MTATSSPAEPPELAAGSECCCEYVCAHSGARCCKHATPLTRGRRRVSGGRRSWHQPKKKARQPERHVAGTTEGVSQMNTSEVLNRAADLIEERGWTAGSGWTDLQTSNDPLCIQGAIATVMGYDTGIGKMSCPAGQAVMAYLGIKLGLFSWNDHLLYVDGDVMGGYVGGTEETAHAHAARQAIETLRAAAIIAAAQEVDIRVVAPEAELTAVSLADVAGAVV